MFQRLLGELGAPPHSGVSETCVVSFRVFVFGFLNIVFVIFWLHIGFYKVLGGCTPKKS